MARLTLFHEWGTQCLVAESRLPRLNWKAMAIGRHLGWTLAACAWACVAGAPAVAQSASGGASISPQSQGSQSSSSAKKPAASDPAPCSVIPEPEPCGTKPAPPGANGQPSSTEKFPFPGAAGDPVAPGIGGLPSAVDAPQAPGAAGAANPASPARKFPFPGDTSGVEGGQGPGAGSSSSSSSSASDPAANPDADVNGTPALKDAGSEGTQTQPGRHILHRVNPIGTKLQSPDEREAEDLKVAKFYQGSGDLAGAYLRTQDAVKTIPDDPDAHFALAEIAVKLGKREEAIAEYNACLKLDPTDKQLKNAHKALEKLGK
jgi:hypothetical protein